MQSVYESWHAAAVRNGAAYLVQRELHAISSGDQLHDTEASGTACTAALKATNLCTLGLGLKGVLFPLACAVTETVVQRGVGVRCRGVWVSMARQAEVLGEAS